jgi:hypothetical protein
MSPQSVQLDPLNSPHPVPWNWVLANLQPKPGQQSVVRYYRSQSLRSPDGEYAAYSRIQMQVSANFTQSRVSSVLFLENLRTGNLQTITASSPLSETLFPATSEPPPPGAIAILIPVSWSADGERILAREFESLFGSDVASDYAVIWHCRQGQTYTIAPTRVSYSHAVLLGWSQSQPERVLFRAGQIGEEHWPLWTVDRSGLTTAAPGDQPMIYGEVMTHLWAGPQAHR